MPKEVRVWRIEAGDRLREVEPRGLDLESRLEDWLEPDISILSEDLLVIARQVKTDHGGIIDLLCLDRLGDVGIVELKRDKTPREVTAQTLDYASWVRTLSHDDITRIANSYLSDHGSTDLPTAFQARFGLDVPDVINEDHSILIVASSIDPSSERIIEYLSDAHGVRINAATFHYFRDGEDLEHLARVFLLEPETVEQRSAQRGSSKRKQAPPLEEYEEIARERGVGPQFQSLIDGLGPHLSVYSLVTMVSCYGSLYGGQRALLNLEPKKSSADVGLHFTLYLWRMADFLGFFICLRPCVETTRRRTSV